MSQPQILLIQPRWLDATKTRAEIARLQARFPDAAFQLMAEKAEANFDGLGATLPLPGLRSTPKSELLKTVLQLRKTRFDEVIVLTEQPLKEVGYLEAKLWALLARSAKRTLGGIRPIRASEEIGDKWQRGVVARLKVRSVENKIRKKREAEWRQRAALRQELKRNATQRLKCPVCQQILAAPANGEGGQDYARCPQCHSLYFVTVPAMDVLKTFYDADYFAGKKIAGTLDQIHREPHKRLETFVYLHAFARLAGTATGNYLDIGSGPGYALDMARDRHWNVTGIDISVWAAQQATARGHRVLNGDFLALDLAERFRFITMIDTLAHLSDPVVAIQKLARLLEEEGIAVIRTVNPAGLGETLPLPADIAEISFPGEQALRLLSEQAGLEVLEAEESLFAGGTLELWLRKSGNPTPALPLVRGGSPFDVDSPASREGRGPGTKTYPAENQASSGRDAPLPNPPIGKGREQMRPHPGPPGKQRGRLAEVTYSDTEQGQGDQP